MIRREPLSSTSESILSPGSFIQLIFYLNIGMLNLLDNQLAYLVPPHNPYVILAVQVYKNSTDLATVSRIYKSWSIYQA